MYRRKRDLQLDVLINNLRRYRVFVFHITFLIQKDHQKNHHSVPLIMQHGPSKGPPNLYRHKTKDSSNHLKLINRVKKLQFICLWSNMLLFNIFIFECDQIDFTLDFPQNQVLICLSKGQIFWKVRWPDNQIH